MIVALGKLAVDADLGAAGIIDPMLRTQAARAFDAASRGSALELRASLVLLALSCDALRGALLALAPAVGYDVGRLGGALYGAVEAMGGDPEQAATAVLTMIKATRAPAPAAAPEPAPTPVLREGQIEINGQPHGPRRPLKLPEAPKGEG